MADSVVTSLLQNLFDLLKEEANFLAGVEDKVKSLHDELSFIDIFLEDSAEKRKDKTVNEVVRQIRDVAYEAEDMIDRFIHNVAKHRRTSAIRRMLRLPSNTLMIRNVGKKIEGIKEKIEEIYKNGERYGIERVEASGKAVEEEAMHRRRREVEEDDVVGFFHDSTTLIKQLTEGDLKLDAISIIGMGGLGKTTLARKIYNNLLVMRHFNCHVWVCVSQDFRIRELLLQILKELGLGMGVEDMSEKSEYELKEILFRSLQGRRFLVVMDDIWRAEVWDEVKSMFPDNSNGSRILITSRNKEVALYASQTPPYYLPFLNENESWELFRKVFRGGTCPPELETLGRQIAKGCKGLPLSIVVLAGRLAKMDKSLHIWSKGVGDVTSFLNSNEDTTICQKILSLSYTDLPRHLKPCFLYLGIYPEDFEIPVSQLINLWVAEDFIQRTGNRLPEDDAEMYLEELIDRSLIQVARRRRIDGGVKTCRIHDLLRDFCISESAEEKFLEVHPGYEHLSTNNSRRLSIQGNTSRYLSSNLHVPKNVRSVFFFDTADISYDDCVTWKWLEENFKLLRVIDYAPVSVMPKSLKTFIHLRYLRIDGHNLVFPDSVCNLTNLVTLCANGVGGSNRYLPKGIFKLQRLRNLYLSDHRWSLPWNSKGVLWNLQVLSSLAINYDPKNHRFLVVPEKFPNVRELVMFIDRPSTLEAEHEEGSFPSLHHLAHLEALEIRNCGMLAGYSNSIPSTVTKLDLHSVERIKACVAELGKLPNLRILKLSGDESYEYVSIHVIAHSFPQLQFLKLRGLRIEEWKKETSAMPRLTHLVFIHCRTFTSVPELLSSTTLQYVKVVKSPRFTRMLRNIPGKVGFELIIDDGGIPDDY